MEQPSSLFVRRIFYEGSLLLILASLLHIVAPIASLSLPQTLVQTLYPSLHFLAYNVHFDVCKVAMETCGEDEAFPC